MDNELANLVKNIVWGLRRVVSLIYQDSNKMSKIYGITGPQSLVIKCLYASGFPLSSTAISRSLYVTPANMTGIIDRLEQKGLVNRLPNQDDRRLHLVELTEEGKKFAERLPDLTEIKLIKGLGDLKPTEIYGIYSALETVIKIMEDDEITAEDSLQV